MPKGNCKFNGSGREYLSLFVIHLFLLSIITLGLYSPWAWVRLFKLRASHTVINGKEVIFVGTGLKLFGICLVNILLTIITLGIYYPWAICRISKWKALNTLVGGKKSDFVGKGGSLFVFCVVHLTILPMLTLGIYYFYGIYRYYAWKEEHMKYGGEKTSFGSGFWGLMKIFLASSLVWLLLPIAAQFLSLPSIDLLALIILILLAPWFICMFFIWQTKGLTVGDEEGIEHFPPVKTRFLLVAVIILIELLSLAAAGLFLKDWYKMHMPEMSNLTQFLEMKTKDLRMQKSIRVPIETPSHEITPKAGTKVPPGTVPPKETLAPSPPKKPSLEKPTRRKSHTPALPLPEEKQVRESKDYSGEIREFDELIKQDRQNASLYYSRGCLYERNGDLDKAKNDFTRSIDINNRAGDAYYNRGLLLVKKKKYALAVKDFDKAIELDSRAVDAYCNRGSANYQLGRSDLAMKDYNQGLKINPDDADLYYNRGIVHLSKGHKSKADMDFKKAAMLGNRLASEMISGKERAGEERCNFDNINIDSVPMAPFMEEVRNKIDISKHPDYENMPLGEGNYRNTVDPFYFERNRGKMPSYEFRQFTTNRNMREILNWYKKKASPGTCEKGGAFAQGGGSYANGPFNNSAFNFGVNNGHNFIVITGMRPSQGARATVYIFHYRTAPPS